MEEIRDLGTQPLESLMERWGVSNHDLSRCLSRAAYLQADPARKIWAAHDFKDDDESGAFFECRNLGPIA